MEDRAVAVVTQSVAYGSTYQAFERPPDYLALNSMIPRGVRRFFIDQALDAKPVNDEIELFMTATLPLNFAYLLRSVTFQISVDTAADWETTCLIRMFNAIPNQPSSTETQAVLMSDVTGSANGTPSNTIRSAQLDLSMFTGPFWPTDGNPATFRISAFNTAAAVGAAGTIRSHVDFFEYDLTQAQKYYLNTPIPVMRR